MYQGSYDFQLIRLRWISLTYEPYTRNREKRHRYREPYYEITCQPICPANVYLHNVSQIRAIVIRLFTTACLIGHSMHLPLSLLFPGYTYMREFGISRTDDRTQCAVAPGYLCETIQQFRYAKTIASAAVNFRTYELFIRRRQCRDKQPRARDSFLTILHTVPLYVRDVCN